MCDKNKNSENNHISEEEITKIILSNRKKWKLSVEVTEKRRMEQFRTDFINYVMEHCPYAAQISNFPLSDLFEGELKVISEAFDLFAKQSSLLIDGMLEFRYNDKTPITYICANGVTLMKANAGRGKEKYARNGIITIAAEDDFAYLLHTKSLTFHKKGKNYHKLSVIVHETKKGKKVRRVMTLGRFLYICRNGKCIKKYEVHHYLGSWDNIALLLMERSAHNKIHNDLKKQGIKTENIDPMNELRMKGYNDEQINTLLKNLDILDSFFHSFKGVRTELDLTQDISHFSILDLLKWVELF